LKPCNLHADLYVPYQNGKSWGRVSAVKNIVLLTLFCLVFLIGCSKDTTERNNADPIEYLESFGWHVEGKVGKAVLETKNSAPSIAAIFDLKPYADKEVYITTYLLREKHKTGKKLYACIYQVNENIIGGYGHIETWEPGIFSLHDKERLADEETIKQ